MTAVYVYKICTGQMENVKSTVMMLDMPVVSQLLPKINVIVQSTIFGLIKFMNVEEIVLGMQISTQPKSLL